MRRGKPPQPGQWERLREEARRSRQERERSYRDKALKILPHVCARCGRDHSGKRLSELTVHHKDHDPDNNPPDGSNWELLCVYCHDQEHQRAGKGDEINRAAEDEAKQGATHKPFAGLGELLSKKK